MYIPTEYVMYINIALVVFLVIALIVGYIKGFLLQVVQALTVIVAIVLAWLLSPTLASTIKIWPVDLTPFQDTVLSDLFYEKINASIWFIIIFVIVVILMLLLRPIVKAIGKIPVLKQVNKLMGMVFSLLIYGFYILIVIFILNTPLFTNGATIVEDTWLKPAKEFATTTFGFIEKPLLESEKLQNLIANRDNLSPDDFAFLSDWLKQQGIDESTVIEFFQQVNNE
ncbi:MAG: CvpA family protein [Erysipelotrichaceae bacterium]|nr:CvpA family protein [Erysipelotrichaceae bacterium]